MRRHYPEKRKNYQSPTGTVGWSYSKGPKGWTLDSLKELAATELGNLGVDG